jgi:uncharacterized protein (DUF1330 family)
MAAYVVATFTVSDEAAFKAYADAIVGLRERFGGASIARGPVIEALEGEVPPGERMAILRFPDATRARAYFASPEYRAGARFRAGAGAVTLRLLDAGAGLDEDPPR